MKGLRLKDQGGFTLIELMVALVVFGLAMAAATSSFLPLVGHFTQQSKIAETQMESMMSLDVLRDDVAHAGYGLPQEVLNLKDTDGDGNLWDELTGYEEALPTFKPAADFNDADVSTGVFRAPRAIVLGNNAWGINGSDYLVIRSTEVRKFQDAGKWTYVHWDKDTGHVEPPHIWLNGATDADEDPDRNFGDKGALGKILTKIIIMKTVKGDEKRLLVANTDDNSFYTDFGSFKEDIVNPANVSPFQPNDPLDTYIVYAVGDKDDELRMPFNRADYFISTASVPSRCAPNTGVLMKAVLQQNRGGNDGQFSTYLPLFDCVADMQIILGLDMDENGTIGTFAEDAGNHKDGLTESENAQDPDVNDTLNNAVLLRNRLKEVRIYILAHEGQRDPGFKFKTKNEGGKIDVGEFTLGQSFDLAGTIDAVEYKQYRWMVYTMVITPENLR